MNIRGQINWWQVLVMLLMGFLTVILMVSQYVVGTRAELETLIGPYLAGAIVTAATAIMAMLTGRPVKEIAEDVAETITRKEPDRESGDS